MHSLIALSFSATLPVDHMFPSTRIIEQASGSGLWREHMCTFQDTCHAIIPQTVVRPTIKHQTSGQSGLSL